MKRTLILIVTLLILFVACDTPTPRTSRHTPYCSCFHEIDGRNQKLSIADEESEQMLDLILDLNGIGKDNYVLCQARMKNVAGMARTMKNKHYIYINDESVNNHIYEDNFNLYKLYLISHEVYHTILHTKAESGSDINGERECGVFAGSIMYRMGISLSEALSSAPIGRERSATHPSGREVQQDIEMGYKRAKAIDELDIQQVLNKFKNLKYARR